MLGVIGGSGLYSLEKLKIKEQISVETPFGTPSSPITLGEYEGRQIAFLPRHGNSHQFLPSEINFKANIFALKKVGVTSVASISAVGSLREDIAPGDLALVGQYIDFTKKRESQKNTTKRGANCEGIIIVMVECYMVVFYIPVLNTMKSRIILNRFL